MTQARIPPYRASAWPGTLRRGATLGVVAACHLALLALMLRPSAYHEPRQRVPHDEDDALRLVFIPPATLPQAVKAPSRTQPRHKPAPAPRLQPTAATPRASGNAAPTIATSLPPRPTTDAAAHDYQPGDFRRRLHGAQRASTVTLPGGTAPRPSSLRLRVAPSARDLVRQLTMATRCTAEGFKMRASKTEFITAQLMDRALEADGCGPHTDHTPTGEVVDAITRQVMEEQQ